MLKAVTYNKFIKATNSFDWKTLKNKGIIYKMLVFKMFFPGNDYSNTDSNAVNALQVDIHGI